MAWETPLPGMMVILVRGPVAVGQRADFIVPDMETPALAGVPDDSLLDALVFSSPGPRMQRVVVADVVALPELSADVDLLVEALAGFGAARRAEMIENGEPVTKPSDRKPSARRRKTASE